MPPKIKNVASFASFLSPEIFSAQNAKRLKLRPLISISTSVFHNFAAKIKNHKKFAPDFYTGNFSSLYVQ